jgi:hypothetical protein
MAASHPNAAISDTFGGRIGCGNSRCLRALYIRLDVRFCAGFSDAEMVGSPHARTVGVGEAPRHEVAGGGAPSVQRALRGGAPVGTELAK